MVRPLVRCKDEPKRVAKFQRPQADRFLRLGKAWRKPRGIDSGVRRRFRGFLLMPKIGYGTRAISRHVHRDGFRRFVINRPEDLTMLVMQARRYAAVVAGGVSSRKRREIAQRAAELGVKVSNVARNIVHEKAPATA